VKKGLLVLFFCILRKTTYAIDPYLRDYWKLDESGGTTAYDGAGNHDKDEEK
jgi:hypothetical protein